MSIKGLTFSKSGNNFVYSDSPEAFTVSTTTLYYLWGCSIGTSFKDFEMYHHLYNGDSSNKALRVGVAVQNNNSSAITITYKCKSAGVDISSSSADSTALSTTPTVLKNYLDASTQTVSVPAGGKVFVAGYTDNFVVGSSKFVTVRGQIKSSVSSNVYIRLFVAGANKTNSITELFNTSSYVAGDSNHFTGELTYTQKNASVDANSGYTYRIFESPTSSNTNEYAGVTSYKSGGLTKLDGNYGVIYKLTISNASGKKIKITPVWSSSRTSATVVYRINSGSWTARTAITTNACWYLSLGTSTTSTIEILLPGGNFGNYDITFD